MPADCVQKTILSEARGRVDSAAAGISGWFQIVERYVLHQTGAKPSTSLGGATATRQGLPGWGQVMFRRSNWFEWPASRSREATLAISTGLVVLIAIFDYLTGWRISWATVYAYPIIITAWYVGPAWAYALSLLSVVLFQVGDLAAGFEFPSWLIPLWNTLTRLIFYIILIQLLLYVRALAHGLEI